MKYVIAIIIYFLHPSKGHTPLSETQFIIWNVGQGQWVTAVEFDRCLHFDFGGEYMYLKNIKSLFLKNCKNKLNELYLSHADFDHYSFFNFIKHNTINTCWGNTSYPKIKKYNFLDVKTCEKNLKKQPHIIYQNPDAKSKNDSSLVRTYKGFLFPGDSTIQQEQHWGKFVKNVQFVVVGHHGSKTSSGDYLLSHLNRIQLAIVQARRKKYGHPHQEVVNRFQNAGIQLILTEDFGHIFIKSF